MNYGEIKYYDIANGEGVRVSLFVSGCDRHCPECFNKETWNFDYGKPFTYETLIKLLDAVDKPYIKGLSILGGEPLNDKNIGVVETIVKAFRLRFGNTKDLWIYTGNTMYIDHASKPYLNLTFWNNLADVIVDGDFQIDKKDPSLWYRGSSNQRILHVSDCIRNRFAS